MRRFLPLPIFFRRTVLKIKSSRPSDPIGRTAAAVPSPKLELRSSGSPPSGRGLYFFNLFIVIVSLLTCLIVFWYAWRADQDLRLLQTELAKRSVEGAADQIALQISELQRTVRIFVEEEFDLLEAVLQAPDDPVAAVALREKIAVYFPELVSYALANAGGRVRVEDLNGLIGPACRGDIRHFGKSARLRGAYIHPDSRVPHFDIMARVVSAEPGSGGKEQTETRGIFFVSFSPEKLIRVIRLSAAPGHRLVLLRKDMPNVVELTADGPRGTGVDEGVLTREQRDKVLFSSKIEGTLWELVDLPDEAFFERRRRETWFQTTIMLVSILILAGITILLLNRQESKRRLLELENRRLAAFPMENPNPVISLDARGEILFVNPASTALEEKLGLRMRDVLPEDYKTLVREQMKTGEDLRNLHVRTHGKVFSWQLHPIRPLGITYLYGSDITERVQAKERAASHLAELAHAGRLSTMGEMATGLAHELNQPLAAIRNYVQGSLLRLSRGEYEAVYPALETARGQADRAAKIILRLRELTRKQDPSRSPVGINELVEIVLELVDRDIKQREIEVTLALHPDVPIILADRIQIEQVLLNLARNAIEAVGGDAIERPHLIITTGVEGDYVLVSVEDNGDGLPHKGADKVFDAFFTTKSEGMGMGLSISRTIIENHHGKLWAESSAGGGARFWVRLPIEAF